MKQWDVPWSGTSIDTPIGQFGELLDAIGSTSFSALLYRLLSKHVSVERLLCSSIDADDRLHIHWIEVPRPELLAAGKQAAQKYLKTYYRHDPLWKELPKLWQHPPDPLPRIFFHWLHAREITATEWQTNTYSTAGLGDRVIIVAFHPNFGVLALTLLRLQMSGDFSEAELAWLTKTAPFLFRVLFRHEGIRYDRKPRVDLAAVQRRLLQLRQRVTPREAEVCSHILQGTSFEEIGQLLNIKHATVKTLRDRAFEKLGISSRFELFAILLG